MSKNDKKDEFEVENKNNIEKEKNKEDKEDKCDKQTDSKEKKHKMPKWLKRTLVALISIAVSFVILTVIAWRIFVPQLGYFEAWKWAMLLIKSQTNSTQTLENEIAQTQKNQVDNINKYTNLNITDDIANELNSGNLSEDEIVDKLLGKEPAVSDEQDKEDTSTQEENATGDTNSEENSPPTENNTPTGETKPPSGNDKTENKPENKPNSNTQGNTNQNNGNNQNPNGTSPATQPSYSKNDERIAQLVAKMYVLKSQYTGQVQGIVNKMISDFAALPPEERTTGAKTSIAQSYLGTITSLEAQCDAQVNAITTELRAVLKESGGDMALVNAIEKAYANEKEATKAYYLNKYS